MRTIKQLVVVFLVSFVFAVVVQPVFSAEKINLNTATIEQLTELKGIGPVTAQKIDEYRKAKAFSSVDELTEVSGVGPKTLEKLRDQLMVDDTKQP